MHTSKNPSAMPIVQPHQNKFRVFLLIAQLMVQKFFLNAHFKIIFCWLSSLVVSIRVLVLCFSFLTGFSGFIIWRHTSIRLSFKVFLLQFSSHRIVSFWDAHFKKTFCHANCAAPPEKFRVFCLNCTTDGPNIFFGCVFQNSLLLIVLMFSRHRKV